MDLVTLFVPDLANMPCGKLLAARLPEIVSDALTFEGFESEQQVLGPDSVVVQGCYGPGYADCQADAVIRIEARFYKERRHDVCERVREIRTTAQEAFQLEHKPHIIVSLVFAETWQSGGPGSEFIKPAEQLERVSMTVDA